MNTVFWPVLSAGKTTKRIVFDKRCANGWSGHGLAATRCINARRSGNLRSSHVFRTEADPDQSGRNSPQNWPAAQELQGPRKGQRFRVAKDPANHVVLNNDLEPLRGLSREGPTPLYGAEFVFGGSFLQKSLA